MSVSLFTRENDQENKPAGKVPESDPPPVQAKPVRQAESVRQAEPVRQTAEKPLAIRIAVYAALLVALILFFILGLCFGGWLVNQGTVL